MTEVPFAESMQTGTQNVSVPPFFVGKDSNTETAKTEQNSQNNESNNETQPVAASPEISVTPPDVSNLNLPTKKSDKKYHIIDLYWVINPKLNQGQILQNEAHLAVLSYNISFNNLRIVFYRLTQASFQGPVLFLNNCERLIDGTIYPSSAYVILNYPSLSNFPCIEQLITQTGQDWQNQRPNVIVSKNADNSTIELKINEFIYSFQNYQFNLFLDACKFILTDGRVLHGYYNLIK